MERLGSGLGCSVGLPDIQGRGLKVWTCWVYLNPKSSK